MFDRTRGPRFESSRWQIVMLNIFINFNENTKIKKKRPGIAHFYVLKTLNADMRRVLTAYRYSDLSLVPKRTQLLKR